MLIWKYANCYFVLNDIKWESYVCLRISENIVRSVSYFSVQSELNEYI